MRIIKLISICIIILSFIVGIWISRANVELTEGGVYTNIFLPLGSQSIKINALRAKHAESPSLKTMQGPVVTTSSLKENYIDKSKQLRKFSLFNYDDWYALFGGGDFVKTQSEVYEKYFE